MLPPCMTMTTRANRDVSLHHSVFDDQILMDSSSAWGIESFHHEQAPPGLSPVVGEGGCCFMVALRTFLCGGEVKRAPRLDIPSKIK